MHNTERANRLGFEAGLHNSESSEGQIMDTSKYHTIIKIAKIANIYFLLLLNVENFF